MTDDIVHIVAPQRVGSPCVNLCRLDRETGWCLGCGRTGDEIARWTSVDDVARQAVLDALPARMAILGAAAGS